MTPKTAASHIERLQKAERASTPSPTNSEFYHQFHRFRHEHTLSLCKRFVPSSAARVLDVGTSALTLRLREHYEDVWTLGFPLTHIEPQQQKHIPYDLSQAADVSSYPSNTDGFDLIVFAETLEHLSIPPEYALLCLSTLLRAHGRILVTTPNGVSFPKRVKMLLGRYPVARIRYCRDNPGHFREYTVLEIRHIANCAALRVEDIARVNFYAGNTLLRRFLSPFMYVPSLRDSIVAVLSPSDSPGGGAP
jgi:2-polyprenyl-3-methyl-5-hydroxy-6-metoxy-1,4-benzoquinol methylase